MLMGVAIVTIEGILLGLSSVNKDVWVVYSGSGKPYTRPISRSGFQPPHSRSDPKAMEQEG